MTPGRCPMTPVLGPAICPTCDGSGWVPAWDDIVGAYTLVRCPDCQGDTHDER